MTGALDGMHVVDLTNGFAGNSCTKLLADLGADVIKVESPGKGEFTRTLVPWVFQTFNRNKRSFAVNLRSEEGVELVYRLLERSDIFVQSLRPGAAESLGLGHDEVTRRNPRLIHASLSGFGCTGPSSHRKGVDVVIQAESGLSTIQGKMLTNTSFVDASAGLHLLAGLLASVIKRERTGVVDHVTVNLLDSALYLESVPMAEYSVTGHVLDPSAYVKRFPTVSVFSAADGPLFLAAYWDSQWQQLCALLDRPDLVTDERFRTLDDRRANVTALRSEMDREFGRRPRKEWVAELDKLAIMAGSANTFADVLADDQVRINDSFETLTMSDGREASFVRPAVRFAGCPWAPSSAAPRVGEHTAQVLAHLGVEPAEMARLADAGVIGSAEGPVS